MMNPAKQSYHPGIKTVVDYFVAVFCLIVLIPIIIVLAVAIKISSHGPVIFSQERLGKNGKPFILYKFRSMFPGPEQEIPLLSGVIDKRITILGRFMRKHKFDEIPNFINVLKGEMSIIGPRPEQHFFVDQIIKIKPDYLKLQSVKPGITSWGQIMYGYAENVEQMTERLEYDLYYLNNWSPWFDLKIAIKTIGIIIRGQGI